MIRNAGGVVTDDAIRSLTTSQRLLGTEAIVLIHHTDCGMLTFSDDEVRREVLRPGKVARPVASAVVQGRTMRVDVVVVGAGTAGANVAAQLARRGRSVVVLERRAADAGGAQWHNGVLPWQFEEAGVAPPRPPERHERDAGATHIFGPDGTHGVTVRGNPVVRADMALLGARLRQDATDAGVDVIDRVKGVDAELDSGGRLRAVGVERAEGASLRIEADLFVDASGRHGVLRRSSPALRPWCPRVEGPELCTASDHVVSIDDVDRARRFLDHHDAQPGDSVTVVGIEGGWSTRSVTVSPDLDHAAVLVGCVAANGHGPGPRLLEETRRMLPWLGASRGGGAGLIPLRRPYARFTAPGLALVGDAACQVFPAHGSGIGTGLIAGRLLADAVAGADDIGDEAVLWRYQHRFQDEYGGVLAAFDAFRRLSSKLGSDGVGAMVGAGLLDEDTTRAGLDQRWPSFAPARAATMAARMAKVPAVAAKMLPMLARAQLLVGMGSRHPTEPDEVALAQWDRKVGRLLGGA